MRGISPKNKSRLAFLFGLGSMTQIRIVGAMGITEAVCIFLSPFVFINIWPRFGKTKGVKVVLFMLLWFLSAIITDIYRKSSLDDAVRGIFVLPFLFAVFVVAFALLWDDLMRVKWMVLGMAVSGIISIFFFRTQALIGRAAETGMQVEEIINFKLVYASVLMLVIGVITVFLFKRRPMLVVLILLGASFIYLLQGYRNGFLTLLLCAGGSWLSKDRFFTLRKLQENALLLVAIVAISGITAMEIYAYAVQKGWLGESELEKYKNQTDSSVGLLEGRAQFIASMFAIRDSPILGHGSWAVDKSGYGADMYRYIDDKDKMEQYNRLAMKKAPWIPTHSHLWQAWVWHGFLGGLFWIYTFILILQYLKTGLHLCRPLIAYNLLLFIGASWDLFFSPFSQRPRWAVVFTIISLTLAEVQRRRKMKRIGGEADINSAWSGRWHI